MTEAADFEEMQRRTLSDYLDALAKVLYGVGAVMFVGGLWLDLTAKGTIVIPWFVIANDPHSNSGLFIGAMITLVLAFAVSNTGSWIERYRREPADDETQEWVVDVGNGSN